MRVFGWAITALLLLLPVGVSAQLSLTAPDTPATENFNAFDGTGFAPVPSPGQLDSDTYAVSDTNTLAGDFGGTYDSGLYAGGTTTGGVVSPGVYAVEWTGGFNFALMFQPDSNDLNVGYLRVRVVNNSGVALSPIEVRYDVIGYNDGTRDVALSFSYATEAGTVPFTNYTSIPEVNYDTSGLPASTHSSDIRTTSIPVDANDFQNGDTIYLLFRIAVSGGSGASYDEVAIDDLSVTGKVDPVITSIEAFTASGGDPIPEGNWTNDPDPYFSWSASAVNPVDGYSHDIDAEPDCTSDVFDAFVQLPSLSQGMHTFQVRAIDSQDNCGPAASFAFGVDSVADSIVEIRGFTEPAGDPITSGVPQPDNNVYLEWDPPVSTSPIEGYAIAIDEPLDCELDTAAAEWFLGPLSPGTTQFQARALDAAGNCGPAAAFEVVVSESILINGFESGN